MYIHSNSNLNPGCSFRRLYNIKFLYNKSVTLINITFGNILHYCFIYIYIHSNSNLNPGCSFRRLYNIKSLNICLYDLYIDM